MPLEIHLGELVRGACKVRGELAAAELGLERLDELIGVHQPLRYDLEVERLDEALLARGRLELVLDCTCSRCLREFAYPVVLADWALHLPVEGEEGLPPGVRVVDLTPHIREDILLLFPQHPLCKSGCAGLPVRPGADFSEHGGTDSATGAGSSSVWSDLDRLKL
jgi:uncharacterized protein